MPNGPRSAALLGNLLPVGRGNGLCRWIADSPNDDPFATAVSDKPNRRIDRWVSLGGQELAADLLELVPDGLDRKVVEGGTHVKRGCSLGIADKHAAMASPIASTRQILIVAGATC